MVEGRDGGCCVLDGGWERPICLWVRGGEGGWELLEGEKERGGGRGGWVGRDWCWGRSTGAGLVRGWGLFVGGSASARLRDTLAVCDGG